MITFSVGKNQVSLLVSTLQTITILTKSFCLNFFSGSFLVHELDLLKLLSLALKKPSIKQQQLPSGSGASNPLLNIDSANSKMSNESWKEDDQLKLTIINKRRQKSERIMDAILQLRRKKLNSIKRNKTIPQNHDFLTGAGLHPHPSESDEEKKKNNKYTILKEKKENSFQQHIYIQKTKNKRRQSHRANETVYK